MIEIPYALIPEVVEAVSQMLGEPISVQNGRPIGVGAISKAKWMGPGWIVWTDHYRTPSHATKVKACLSFNDPQQEIVFRLKYPHLIKG